MTPVKMYERQLRETYELAKRTHDAAFAAWRAQKAQIERGKSTLDARLFELEALGPEPAPPIKPICTVYETTAEGLAKNWPNLPGALGIFSAEGGQFLGGHGFSDEAKLRTAASLSQLWDGDGLRRLRAGDGLIDLHGRRLATHLMIQPEAACLRTRFCATRACYREYCLRRPKRWRGRACGNSPRANSTPASTAIRQDYYQYSNFRLRLRTRLATNLRHARWDCPEIGGMGPGAIRRSLSF